MKKSIVFLIMSLLVVPVVAFSATALPNPGFEYGFTNGVADGWTKYTASGGTAVTCSQSTTYAHGGSTYSQKIDATGSGKIGGVYATIDTVKDQTYTVSVWVKALKGTTHTYNTCYLAIFRNGNTVDANGYLPDGDSNTEWVQNTGNTNGAWENLIWQGKATGAKTTIALYAYNGVTAYFDDFSPAAAVPEPSSFLALGTGLIGLAGFAVRRRK